MTAWTRTSTLYQRFLTLSNVFLLILSTALVFSSLVFLGVYHMGKLEFWSWHFYAAPLSMLILGVYTFIVSVYGFLISTRESRVMVILLAVFLGLAFLGQIFSVFSAGELRNTIDQNTVPLHDLAKYMGNYTERDSVRSAWDRMQRTLRCCGGLHYEVGYEEWDWVMPGDVPDSCCHTVEAGCGQGKITQAANYPGKVDLNIWKDGCMEVLRHKMTEEVKPMMMAYVGVGVVLALLELITVVLASAYAAQLSRRARREEAAWGRTAGLARSEAETRPVLRPGETNF